MPLTLDQAIHSQEFHAGNCTCTIGKRGGRTFRVETWRRNGRTQLWKTRPEEFRIPVKYGLKTCDYITQVNNLQQVATPEAIVGIHAAEDCPLRHIPADFSTPGTYTGEEDVFPQGIPVTEWRDSDGKTLAQLLTGENANASD